MTMDHCEETPVGFDTAVGQASEFVRYRKLVSKITLRIYLDSFTLGYVMLTSGHEFRNGQAGLINVWTYTHPTGINRTRNTYEHG